MTQEYFFKNAKWVGARERSADGFSVLRGSFTLETVEKATLRVLGLGFFKCYINGQCINPDTFLPLSSDYEASCDPAGEVLAGHRVYLPEFDVTALLQVGENSMEIHYGGGWYTFYRRVYGLPKAIYCLTVGAQHFISDENCLVAQGNVCGYDFTKREERDLSILPVWEPAVETEPLDTEYCTTDCPPDRLIAELPLKVVGKGTAGIVYDCGENTTGYPQLKLHAKRGEKVEVRFSEELLPDGTIDLTHAHGQVFSVIADGTERMIQPEFTWYGFRCFEVIGDATPTCVKVVHADVPVSSTFDCDNETLNWIYKTFLHTMLCNMHTGHPSDCPHLERRGYTGDGQLTCHAALSVLDGKAFYEKWLQDIGDCQDTLSGHIQYTAPYIRSGGGPGGWGSAIVEVPYQLYRHFGDRQILAQYYPHMRRYIDYLEAHSEFGLVTSDKEGEWCLGDWCGPNILYPEKDITSHNQQVVLPAPMVNTYFMVRSLQQMAKIARIIGNEEDIPAYEEKAALRKKAIRAAYFNTFDGNFIMNVQGANAFAVDLGLGDQKTYPNMVSYYKKLGHFDTGIFATDILIRTLFENGDEELAVELLTNNGEQGFEHWRQNGATTFHEYWDSNRSRSHCHPMFGAPVAYFFEYLLGIRQREDSAGYAALLIQPKAVAKFGRMAGSMKTPAGTVAVRYQKEAGGVRFCIEIPAGIQATFRYGDCEKQLAAGVQEFLVP